MKKTLKTLSIITLLVLCISIFASCDVRDAINSVKNSETATNSEQGSNQGGIENFAAHITTSTINLEINTVSVDREHYGTSAFSTLSDMRNSVVEIYATLTNGTSAGAGVMFGYSEKDGIKIVYIVTCHHVIEKALEVNIKTVDGDSYEAFLVGSDPDDDICVMYAEVDKEMTTATFGDSDDLLVGDEVYAIGNPMGTLGGTVTKGIISALSREITVEGNKMSVLQTDAAINSGNSGGGLFTTDGRLIGIVNAGVSGSVEGLNFAIPSKDALDKVEQLTRTYHDDKYNSYGYIEGKYNLDCTVADSYSRFGRESYIVITSIESDSCMYESGLRAGDCIISFRINGGETVTPKNSTELVDYINEAKLKVGDKIVFSITRSGISKTFTVELTQYIYRP